VLAINENMNLRGKGEKCYEVEIVEFQSEELQKFVSAFVSENLTVSLEALPVAGLRGFAISPVGTMNFKKMQSSF